jgi:hypothetical protein
MVDVDVTASNGTRTLPASVDIAQSEAKMLPSPNALKALRAETGKTYGELLAAGEEAEVAPHDPRSALRRMRRHRTVHHRGRTGGPYEAARLRQLATFCRYWRMTPGEVYAMDGDEYRAFLEYMRDEARAIERERRKSRR